MGQIKGDTRAQNVETCHDIKTHSSEDLSPLSWLSLWLAGLYTAAEKQLTILQLDSTVSAPLLTSPDMHALTLLKSAKY